MTKMQTMGEPWVEVRVEDQRWENVEALCERAFEATLRYLGLKGEFGISVLACDDATIKELNADYRGKVKPTNVLSWPSEERGLHVAGAMPKFPNAQDDSVDLEMGDTALAYETCAREAAEQGKTLEDHVTHLMVHSILHLFGFDHMNGPDAELMEDLEVKILASLGIADPYKQIDLEKGARANA